MKYMLGRGLDRGVTLLHAAHVLRTAVIRLQAREPVVLGNLPCKGNHSFTWLDAAASHADLELDVDVEVAFQLRDVFSVVDAHPDLCPARERGEALELLRPDHL